MMVYFFAKRFLMIINYDLCFDINFIVDLLLFLLVWNGMWSRLPACNAIVRIYCRFFEKVLKIKLLYEVINIDLSIKYGSKIMIQVRIWFLTNCECNIWRSWNRTGNGYQSFFIILIISDFLKPILMHACTSLC